MKQCVAKTPGDELKCYNISFAYDTSQPEKRMQATATVVNKGVERLIASSTTTLRRRPATYSVQSPILTVLSAILVEQCRVEMPPYIELDLVYRRDALLFYRAFLDGHPMWRAELCDTIIRIGTPFPSFSPISFVKKTDELVRIRLAITSDNWAEMRHCFSMVSQPSPVGKKRKHEAESKMFSSQAFAIGLCILGPDEAATKPRRVLSATVARFPRRES